MLNFIAAALMLIYINIGLFIFFFLVIKKLPTFEEMYQLNGEEYTFFRYLYMLLLQFMNSILLWPLIIYDRLKTIL